MLPRLSFFVLLIRDDVPPRLVLLFFLVPSFLFVSNVSFVAFPLPFLIYHSIPPLTMAIQPWRHCPNRNMLHLIYHAKFGTHHVLCHSPKWLNSTGHDVVCLLYTDWHGPAPVIIEHRLRHGSGQWIWWWILRIQRRNAMVSFDQSPPVDSSWQQYPHQFRHPPTIVPKCQHHQSVLQCVTRITV